MAKKQIHPTASFTKDERYDAKGIPIVFYLKKIYIGQGGETVLYTYYNHLKNMTGTLLMGKNDDRTSMKRKATKHINETYPAISIDIKFWR